MLISELIKKLEFALTQYGDVKVYSGGEDYPNEVQDIYMEWAGNAYVPKHSIKIEARSTL